MRVGQIQQGCIVWSSLYLYKPRALLWGDSILYKIWSKDLFVKLLCFVTEIECKHFWFQIQTEWHGKDHCFRVPFRWFTVGIGAQIEKNTLLVWPITRELKHTFNVSFLELGWHNHYVMLFLSCQSLRKLISYYLYVTLFSQELTNCGRTFLK